jgi:FemAB-related protein (PEP-CTERM system-associated)
MSTASVAIPSFRGETPAPLPVAKVRAFANGDAGRWDRFVETCPAATFFHRSGWRDVIENVFHHRCHYLMAESDGEVRGVLPLAEVKSRIFGHSLVSLPFCVYGGVAAADVRTADALVDAAAELGASLRVEYLELRHTVAARPDWPRQDLYVTFRKRLERDAEKNLLAIPRKQRAMVRKGIARKLRSEIDGSSDRFFRLYADNVHRHGTPALPKGYFARLLETFAGASEVMTIVDAAGEPVSAVLSFYFRDEVLPYYAGDVARARDLAANDFKYWELMRRASERDVGVFDYGRSKRGSGSFDFKKNWGFDPAPLAYEYRLYTRPDIPQNNPLNPKYRALVATWRRLPRPVVNVLGPFIVRSLG